MNSEGISTEVQAKDQTDKRNNILVNKSFNLQSVEVYLHSGHRIYVVF